MVNRLLHDKEFREEVNLRAAEKEAVRKLKERLYSKGYKYALSLYGSVEHEDRRPTEYRRIEVMSMRPFREEDYYNLQFFFNMIIPALEYTLFTMNPRGRIKRIYP